MSSVPRSAHVTGWGRYAPAQVLTNADLERMVDTSDEWIVTPHRHPRAARRRGQRDDRVDGAPSPAMRAIRTAGLEPDDIDLILVATLTPDYWMPSTAALVKEAIGNTRAAAMDVAAACSGFVYAYATAHAYITSGHGQARAGHRGGAADPLPRLHRPEHLHPVRRRRRGRRAVGVRRAGRRPRHRADDRARRAPT